MCSQKNRGNEYKVVNFYIVFFFLNLCKWNLCIMLKNKYNRIHKYDEIIKVRYKFFSYLYKTKIYH